MINIINILISISNKMGYGGIIFLMTIESSFIPFPSEIVIPPAAYLAQKGEMNIFFVIISGIIGSLIGAVINYYLAKILGRKIIYSLASHKIARLFLIDEKKIKKAEEYFLKHGKISTFLGRLVVGVRQLISIPAGFSKMKFSSFVIYTTFGSSTWIVILAGLGYFFGSNQELLSKYYKEISVILLLIAIAMIIVFAIKNKKNNIKSF